MSLTLILLNTVTVLIPSSGLAFHVRNTRHLQHSIFAHFHSVMKHGIIKGINLLDSKREFCNIKLLELWLGQKLEMHLEVSFRIRDFTSSKWMYIFVSNLHCCCCEMMARQRYNVFGKLTVEPKDISTASIRDLCLFVRGAGLLRLC